MQRRRFLAAVGAVGTSGLSGCAALASGGDYDVGMTAVAFDPTEVTVEVGDEVVWRNTSSRAHTVTAYGAAIPDEAAYFASGGFDTESAARDGFNTDLAGAITSGDTYTHTFDVSGRYDYFCIPHEQGGMVGAVVVEE